MQGTSESFYLRCLRRERERETGPRNVAVIPLNSNEKEKKLDAAHRIYNTKIQVHINNQQVGQFHVYLCGCPDTPPKIA